MDGQEEIKRVVDRLGTEEMVVLLGTPNAESSRLYGMTVTVGDPAWAGGL
ncbi:MAG: glycine/sarcosine/betaine reductase complex selenoprotein A, partial [Chloroflexi bacterium]|nr:glycine/sarcosine/betaine reductase complex selenoprotein A [Chloroflexota bacterium]